MSKWTECICGADITKAGDAWIDLQANTLCYPDADNEVDRAATHVALDWLEAEDAD